MTLTYLEHVNIRTANLAEMSRFYEKTLGMKRGPRPSVQVGGAWYYCADKPVVHLLEVPRQPEVSGLRLEHFAFRANGLSRFLSRLRKHGVSYSVAVVPGAGNKQVNIYDPDGNHIEVQFDAPERADLKSFDATRALAPVG